MPVLQIRKEIGEVTELIPEERISECIVEEITDVPVPHRRARDSHRRTGPIWVTNLKKKKNKLEELKIIVVVEGNAEYSKMSRTA